MLERAVAHGVAEAVVDRLEVVEVEHQDGERFAVAPAAPDLRLDAFLDGTPVEQAGQPIMPGAMPEVGEQSPNDQRDQRGVKAQHDDHVAEGGADVEAAVGGHFGRHRRRPGQRTHAAKAEAERREGTGQRHQPGPAQVQRVPRMDMEIARHHDDEQCEQAREGADAQAPAFRRKADIGSEQPGTKH